MQNRRRLLDSASNVAICVIAILCATTFFARMWRSPSSEAERGEREKAKLLVGKSFAKEPDGKPVVYLALSTRCAFCERSTDFYQELQKFQTLRAKYRTVVVSSEPSRDMDAWLASHGLHFDVIRTESLTQMGVRGTPTIMIANSEGVVQNAFVGLLGKSQQQELLTDIDTNAR